MTVRIEIDNQSPWASDFVNIPSDTNEMTTSQVLGDAKKISCGLCLAQCSAVIFNA